MPHWNIIYKTGTVEHVRATVKRLECHGKLMDERYVTVDIDSPSPISFSAGDFMMYRGEKFSIRNIADVEKSARPQSHGGAFSYKGLKLVAQGWQELQDTEMTDYVGINDNRMHYTGLGTFSFYMTKVSDLGYRVQAVLDNKYGTGADGWTVNWPSGQLDNLDEAKSISISAGSSVKDALDLLWQNWGITYTVSRKTITMRPSSAGSILLSYGKGNGLTKIARKLNPNVEICTRVRAYGSERNMPYHWYNNKYEDVNEAMYIPQLMLPHVAAYYDSNGNYVNDAGQLYEAGDDEVVGSVNLWATPNDVVLENVVKSAIYGKRDKEIHWNSDDMGEIFPSMKGMTSDDVPSLDGIYESDIPLDHVTGFHYASESDTGSSSPEDVTSDKLNFVVRVPNPGFNPADHNTADNVELLMQSGMCQARAFTIVRSEAVVSDDKVVAYDLTCAKIIDEEIDQVFPNATYTIKAEDEYVYTGLEFNGDYSQDTWLDVYVQAAERRLLRAAAIWLREHSGEDFVYELTLDNIYMKENPTVAANLVEGAMIQIPDIEFGSNEYEIIDSLTITEGKEAIPTYEITLLRKDESESLGDRVKGLVGQSISASSEIAKANDSLTRKVNKAGFHSLFDPLDAQYNVLDINGDLSNLKYIRANVDFFSTGGVSALGVGASGGGGGASALAELTDVTIQSPQNGQYLSYNSTTGKWENVTGGGGGGATLREPLASINNASLGTPTESGQVLTWNGSQWVYAIPQGGGGGGTGTVTSITAGTGLSGGTITTMGTIAISSEYQTRIANGQTAYGWGNHANAGYLTSSDIADMATKTWVNQQGFVTANNYLTAVTGSANGTMTFAREGLSSITFDSRHTHSNYVSSIYYNNSATLSSPYYVVTSGSVSGNTLTLGRRKLSDLLNAAGYTWWGQTMDDSGAVEGDMTGVGSIAMSGTLRLGSASGASPYIYWGDGTYAYIGEDADDHITLRGDKGVNILTGSNYELEWNGNTLATQAWVEDQGFVKSSGVTSVGLSMPTGFTVSSSPVTSSGTLSVGIASGYFMPTTTQRTTWNNKQDAISDLATIRSNASHGQTAYGWGNHADKGYLLRTEGMRFTSYGNYIAARFVNANGTYDSTRAAKAQGEGHIEWWSDGGYFNHVMGFIRAKGNVEVGTSTTDTAHYLQIGGGRLYWDSTNNALYVQKADGTAAHFYATGGVSALGMGVSGTASLNTLKLGSLSVTGTASLGRMTVGGVAHFDDDITINVGGVDRTLDTEMCVQLGILV